MLNTADLAKGWLDFDFPMGNARVHAGACAINNHEIVILGGWCNQKMTNKHVSFDTRTNTLTQIEMKKTKALAPWYNPCVLLPQTGKILTVDYKDMRVIEYDHSAQVLKNLAILEKL